MRPVPYFVSGLGAHDFGLGSRRGNVSCLVQNQHAHGQNGDDGMNLEDAHVNSNRINLGTKKSKPRFRVNMDSRGRGEIPPVSLGTGYTLVRGMG